MENFEPGIHDIPAERYNAAAGCSASMLDILSRSTPAHLKCWLDGQEQESSEALRFGILVHYAILEGDKYKESFHVRPEGMKLTTKEGKKWKEEHGDKPNVSFDEAAQITSMVDSVRKHNYARALLQSGQPERSLFVFDKLETLRKSRLDALTDGNIIPDIKTCLSASDDAFSRAILNRRYHVRAAYYLDNCNLLNIDKDHFMFICVEKTPPYAVRCLKLDGTAIMWGRKLYEAELQTYRNCLESDEWPCYETSYAEIALPDWEMRRIDQLV
jgi:exodeoxyribonuclease VIII